MSTLRLAKKELRKSIRNVIANLSGESMDRQSHIAASVILSLPEYQKAKTLSVYLSMPCGEVSTGSIVEHALQLGKQVYIPYIHKAAQAAPGSVRSVMDMVTLHSLEDYESLEPDSWGIPTPGETSIAERKSCLHAIGDDPRESADVMHERLDMIIMPGMAFDRDLGRLGHGKGFYDFFLHCYHKRIALRDGENHMPFLVGLALEEQVLPHDQRVPLDHTDWLLDALVIGNGTIARR